MIDMANIPELETILNPGELLDIINIEVNFRGDNVYHKDEMDKAEMEQMHKP